MLFLGHLLLSGSGGSLKPASMKDAVYGQNISLPLGAFFPLVQLQVDHGVVHGGKSW